MIDCGTGDIIALQLEGTDDFRDATVVPRAVAVPGISDALDLGEGSMADRVALLSALEELKSRGLVEERKKHVRGMTGRRNAYFLTDRGRDYVRDLRNRLADETIVVSNGTEEEIPLAEAGRYLKEPAIPRALSRLTDEGVLYVEEAVGESFVDREAEQVLLESALESTIDGDPHLALVTGEAGAGKTTLVTDEFAATARDLGAEVLTGTCRRDTDEPYAPIRRAIEPIDDGTVFERDGSDVEDAEAYAAERTAMFEGVVEAIEAAAAERPILLAIDDLHSADEPTVALFAHLADRVTGRVMLVGTFRPGEAAEDGPLSELLDGWEAADRRLRIDLDRFDRDDTRALIQWVLNYRTVPSKFVDLVYERTGGNPLFVKESVTRMAEDGVVDVDHDVFPQAPDEVPLIDRVEEVVERRLSVLDDDTRSVLEVAALVGETMEFDVLRGAVDMDEASLREHLDLLLDAHVFERVRDDELRFVSGLVREAVVDRIGPTRRREYHGRIAETAAAGGGDREHHAMVAHHYDMAGRHEAAVEHFLEAADRARSVYAHEVALENYERALSIRREELGYDEDDEAIVEVLQRIGDVHYLLGAYDDADRYYRYAADRVDDAERLRRIYRIRSDMAGARGDYETELELAQEGLDRAGIDDTLETCLLLGRKGAGHQNLWQLDEAEAAYEQCLALARRIDDPEGLAAAYLDFGALDIQRGEVDEGTIEMLEEAVDAAQRADDDRGLSRALNNLAMCQLELGRVEAAEETYHRCLAVQEAIGDRMALCSSLRNLASIHREKGDLEAALDVYERAREVADSVRNHNVLSTVTVEIATLHQSRGEMDRALPEMEKSVEHARDLGDPERVAISLAYLIDLHLDRGELDRAGEYEPDLLECLDDVEDPYYRSVASAIRGDLRRERGDLDAAVEHYEEGLSLARAEDVQPAAVLYNAAGLTAVAAERGDAERAVEYAEIASEAGEAAADDWSAATADLHAGMAKRVAGDYDAASAAVERALETYRDPTSLSSVGEVEALVELARIAHERGDDAAATSHLDEATTRAENCGVGRFDDRIDRLRAVTGG